MALGTVAVGLTPSEVSAKTYKDIKEKDSYIGCWTCRYNFSSKA